MRILHALSQCPAHTGSGVYVTQMIRQAAEAGYENGLLAGIPDDFSATVPDCCTYHFVRFGKDLPHTVPGMSDVMPYPSTRFCDMSSEAIEAYEQCFGRALEKAVMEYQPDIIHAHHLWLLTSLIKRRFPDIPVVASCHGSDLRQFRKQQHLHQRVLDGCRSLNAVLALHAGQRDEICELYGIAANCVHVVGAGYADHLFKRSLAAESTAGSSFEKSVQSIMPAKSGMRRVRFVYAGKLSQAKGVPWLLQAMVEVVRVAEERGITVTLTLCGAAPAAEEKRIAPILEELGTSVIVQGAVSQEKLAEILVESDVFVLPSFYEGLPLVLLEALASGCRIVTTRLPGIEEVFGDMPEQEVRFVELPSLQNVDMLLQEDEIGFIRQLQKALLEQIDIDGKPDSAARASVLHSYTWQAVFGRVADSYSAVLREAYFAS